MDTQAEDFLIRDLVEEMGPQFAEIAKLLQGRAASDYFVSPHWALRVGEARKFENCIQIAKQRRCFIQRQIHSKLASLIIGGPSRGSRHWDLFYAGGPQKKLFAKVQISNRIQQDRG